MQTPHLVVKLEDMAKTKPKIQKFKLSELHAAEYNPRVIDDSALEGLSNSISRFGCVEPIIVNTRGGKNVIIGGHQRYKALEKLGEKDAVCVTISCNKADEKLLNLTLNNPAIQGEFFEDINEYIDQIRAEMPDDTDYINLRIKELRGEIEEGGSGDEGQARTTLAERFIVPPFSVLDARQGYWQDRKRAWLALGLQSELGRLGTGKSTPPHGPCVTKNKDGTLNYHSSKRSDWDKSIKKKKDKVSPGGSPRPAADYSKKQRGDGAGKPLGSTKDFGTEGNIAGEQTGTSIFDPVLCEIAYRWFCPAGGRVLDPFAGGSVRGIVANYLGYKYTGVELRAEQIKANKKQSKTVLPGSKPEWLQGDSANIKALTKGKPCDLVFSCPPYYNLEVYSDLEGELSAKKTYKEFLVGYRAIIKNCVDMLKANRFACFVVGDMRDKKGFYRNFVSDTIAAFVDAGAGLYNDAILVTAVGSLPIRAGRQFQSGRKLGKTHQNILVFYKGDPKMIKDEFGTVEAGDLIDDTKD